MDRMRTLVDRLNETAYQYYTLDDPSISDKEWDALYDELVKLRHGMAKKLGFDSYTDLAYLERRRFDYTQEDAANFRRQIREILTGKSATDGSGFDLTVNASGWDIKKLAEAVAEFSGRWFEK